jgi:periplasmic divalent cation tolerance protein
MPDFVVITTTTGDHAVAQQIATDLVDRRLVACAQIAGPVRSVYRWQGRVEYTEEMVVTFKTTIANVEAVKHAIAELHPYDVPELIVTPIIDGGPSYLAWMEEQTRANNG